LFRSWTYNDVTIAHHDPRLVWAVIIMLAFGLFAFDVLTPPGMDDGAAYSILPVVSLALPPPRLRDTLVVAALTTALLFVGHFLSFSHVVGLQDPWETIDRAMHFGVLWLITAIVYARRVVVLASVRRIESLVHRLDDDNQQKAQTVSKLSRILTAPREEKPPHTTEEAWLRALASLPMEHLRRRRRNAP